MPTDSSTTLRRPRIGRYQVVAHIAAGGMGAVYKALDTERNRPVALKILPLDLREKPVLLDRFHREAELAARLKHENIVELYECGEESGFHYLAMEFVDGIDLHQYVIQRQRLNPKKARNIIIQAVCALDHLHKAGIVHRDIKPSNFLITKKNNKGLVKLIDLGLARQAREEELRLTRDGTTVGTVDFMAPEQARDAGAADIRSDMYSLGCTWYFMLAGHPPFPDGSLPERIYKHFQIEPPDIRQINSKVSSRTAEILGQLLAKKPDDRYQTPALLFRDLERTSPKANGLSGNPLAQLTRSTRQRRVTAEVSSNGMSESSRFSRKWLFWAIAAAIALALGISLTLWFSWHE